MSSDKQTNEFLLGTSLWVELSASYVCLYLTFIDVAKYFSKVVARVYTPQKYMRVLMAPHPCQHLIFSIFFYISQPSGYKWL